MHLIVKFSQNKLALEKKNHILLVWIVLSIFHKAQLNIC